MNAPSSLAQLLTSTGMYAPKNRFAVRLITREGDRLDYSSTATSHPEAEDDACKIAGGIPQYLTIQPIREGA